MARATTDAPVLTRRQLNRSLLARQWLLERRSATAEETIEHLVAMQAQEPFDPYTALWSRLAGFQPEELSELIATRRAVRAPSMLRTTIHLVTARDWLRLRPVLQVVQEQGFRGSPFFRNLEGVDLDEVGAEGRRLLDERPRSGNDLGKALAERWPGRDPASLGYAVRSRVPVVQIPPPRVKIQAAPIPPRYCGLVTTAVSPSRATLWPKASPPDPPAPVVSFAVSDHRPFARVNT